jgi:putative addiction module component (TIGR02574 family)
MEAQMTEQSRRVLAEALELPPIERAALVEELLSSFNFPARQEIDKLWAYEAEDRIDAYERGELKASTVESVFSRLNRNCTNEN